MNWQAPWARWLKWAGYVCAYLAAFVVFVYLSFPYARLKSYLVGSYNALQTSPTDSHLEIDSLEWSWRFPGLTASGVRLVVPPPTELDEAGKKLPPRYLEASDLYVTVSPFALLTGAKEASFGASGLGGEIEGWVSDAAEGRRFEIELEDVDAGRVPQVVEAIGLPIRGRLTGTIALDIPGGRLNQADGHIELVASDLEIGDGKAKIKNLMALPPLHVGTFSLKADVGAGRLKLTECTAAGGDLDLTLTGGVRLRRRLESSQADLELKFQFSEKYKNKDDKTRAIFGDGKLPGLFDTVTKGSVAKLADGGYGVRLIGQLSRLNPRPLRVRSKKAPSKRLPRRLRGRKGGAEHADEAEAGDDKPTGEDGDE